MKKDDSAPVVVISEGAVSGGTASQGSGRRKLSLLLRRINKWVLALVLLLFILLISMLAQLYINRDMYMIVGNRVITKSQFNEARSASDGFIKAMGGGEFGEEGAVVTDDSISEKLIFAAALENKAAEMNITVTQHEVDSSLGILAYKLPEEFKASKTFKEAKGPANKVRAYQKEKYGWSEAYSNRSLRTVLLKNKMSSLLNVKSILVVSMPSGIPDIPEGVKAEQMIKDSVVPLLKSRASTSEIVGKARELSNYMIVRIIEYSGKEKNKDQYTDDQKKLFDSLQTVGDVSELSKAQSNSIQVFRLESKTEGPYNSWKDFTNEAVQNTQYISAGFSWQKLLPIKERL